MITLTLLCLAIGEPPQAPPLRLTYADFLARVEKLPPGQTLTLTVGMPGENRCDTAKTYGIADGQYGCYNDGGVAKMWRIAQPATINASGTNSPYTLGSPCANGRCPTPQRR